MGTAATRPGTATTIALEKLNLQECLNDVIQGSLVYIEDQLSDRHLLTETRGSYSLLPLQPSATASGSCLICLMRQSIPCLGGGRLRLSLHGQILEWTFLLVCLDVTAKFTMSSVTFWSYWNVQCIILFLWYYDSLTLFNPIITSKSFLSAPWFLDIVTCCKTSIVFTLNVTSYQVVIYVFALKFSLIYVWMVSCDELCIVLTSFCDISSFCYTSLVNDWVDLILQWSEHGTLIHGLLDFCSQCNIWSINVGMGDG